MCDGTSTSSATSAAAMNRVLAGSSVSFMGGSLYAMFRHLPPPYVMRAGVTCSLFAAPFFVLREFVSASLPVDSAVASALSGGFAGYFGALVVAGPHWQAVTRSAVACGMGAGLVDVVVTGVQWRRKVWLLNRHEKMLVAQSEERAFQWPVWFPVIKQVDEEYNELLRRQQDTVLALEQEQARIRTLLRAIEALKEGRKLSQADLSNIQTQQALANDHAVNP